MRRTSRLGLVLMAVVLGAACFTTPCAAFARFIRSFGTSTSAGLCSITIESFGLLAQDAGDVRAYAARPTSVLTFNINVPIPTSSTANNSATLIRNDVDAALPADYVVTIPIGQPDIVRIDRTTGTFTMTVSEDVAGQTIKEDFPLPMLGTIGWLVMAALLAIAGMCFMRPRRRTARPA